jgi:lysophospholipase L1-like esterase
MTRRKIPFLLAALALIAALALAASLPRRPATILAVGGSTTVLGGEQGWPRRLERLLAEACPASRPRVATFAVAGADSAETAARIGAGMSIYRPDAVITMVGANDHADTHDVLEADLRFFGRPYASEAGLEDALLRRILTEEPLRDRRYTFLFLQPYRDSSRFALGLERNEQVLAHYPDHPFAALEEARFLRILGRAEEADRWRAKAAALGAFPAQLDALAALTKSPAAFDRELASLRARFPKRPELENAAANLYGARGRLREAERALRRLLPFADAAGRRVTLHLLRANLWKQGRRRDALALPAPAPFENLAVTERNYRKMIAVIRGRGAALFPMQYPTRDPAPLRRWAGEEAAAVISNRESFADAADLDRYDSLFVDRFAGDFGHFRPTAAARVAEAAAASLVPWLKEHSFCR